MNDLSVLLLQHGLERLLPYLPRLARPSIRLMENESVGVAGNTRLGGLPDVLPHFRWPCLRDCNLSAERAATVDLDEPLVFLGQVNWGQLKPYDIENVLPATGGAIFFMGIGAAVGVFFAATVNAFAPRHFPLPENVKTVLPRRVLEPRFEWTLPPYGLHGTIGGGDFQMGFFDTLFGEVEFLELSDAERKAYGQFRSQLVHPGTYRHRVLGHADYEQNPMQLDLERRARGLTLDQQTYLTLCDPTASLTRQLKLQALASKWRLAFQVARFSDNDELWGNAGTTYFWSKQDDLSSLVPRFVGDAQTD